MRKRYIVEIDSRLVDTKEFHEFIFMLSPLKFTREANLEDSLFSVCSTAKDFHITYSETYTMTLTRCQLFELRLKYHDETKIRESYMDYNS